MKKLSILVVVLILTLGCSNAQKSKSSAKKVESKTEKTQVEESSKKDVKEEELKPTPGYLKGNKYINEYLGFSIDIPESWSIQGEDQMKQLTEIGSDMIAGDDENLKKTLKASDNANGLFKLAAFEYPLGTPGKLNPNIMAIGENMTNYPGIKDGKDYVENIKMFLNNSKMQMEINDIEPIELDGQTFYGIETEMAMNNININQKYYATIIKRHALGITMTFFDKESREKLEKVLDTVKFKK